MSFATSPLGTGRQEQAAPVPPGLLPRLTSRSQSRRCRRTEVSRISVERTSRRSIVGANTRPPRRSIKPSAASSVAFTGRLPPTGHALSPDGEGGAARLGLVGQEGPIRRLGLRRGADRQGGGHPRSDRRKPSEVAPQAPADARGGRRAGPGVGRPPRRPDPPGAAVLDRLAPRAGRPSAGGPGRGCRGLGDRGAVEGGLGRLRGAGRSRGGGLDDARKAWARARLVERIDEATAELEAHRETLDLESMELDRAEAGDVAWFDPSKEATLARRYESEAQRYFFKTLNELRRVEAESAERPAVDPGPVAESNPAPAEPELATSRVEALASFREDDLEAFERLFPPLGRSRGRLRSATYHLGVTDAAEIAVSPRRRSVGLCSTRRRRLIRRASPRPPLSEASFGLSRSCACSSGGRRRPRPRLERRKWVHAVCEFLGP
jgi:hypothetical protein